LQEVLVFLVAFLDRCDDVVRGPSDCTGGEAWFWAQRTLLQPSALRLYRERGQT